MNCRKCDKKAVISMHQHKLGLCKDHFLEWIPEQTQRFIKKYNMFGFDDKILVAVSGGKDSLSLWDILVQIGYKVDGLYIGLGIDGGFGYSDESRRYSEIFAKDKGLKLHIVDVIVDYGNSITEIAKRTKRGKGKPCSVCGMTKRHIMNRIAREAGYDVLVTGHNLDDEAAVLFGNTLSWAGGYLVRQSPVLEASHPGFVRKTKPLCRFYEREMTAYALLSAIKYIYEECPYSIGAKTIYYKELLNQLEADRPGVKLHFYLSFLQAKNNGLFSQKSQIITQALNTCTTCGQPTSVPGDCAFCRMITRIR